MSNHNNYLYKAFGLNIESDFFLEGLLPADGPTQIRIVEGELSIDFPEPGDENSFWSEGKDKFAYRVAGLGSFFIHSGSEIIIQSKNEMTDEKRALYILGTCMGVLLVQRGLVPIHGSAISINNKEVIFTGHPGAGKSTLTASLIKRGHFFLADDTAALQVNEKGEAWIMPAFPKQKLWRDAATVIYGGIDGLERIPGMRDKYQISSESQFLTESKQLKVLFELSTHSGSEVEIEELKGTEKLSAVIRNTYRFEIIEISGKEVEHFEQCSKIASNIKVYKLRRPVAGYTFEEQISKIMKVLD